MFNQSSKRLISVVLGIVFVVASIVIYFNFVKPAYEEAQRIKAELLNNQDLLRNQQQAVQSVEKLINSEENQYQDIISRALPLNAALAGVLAQINGISENNNMLLRSISFSSPGLGTAGAETRGTASDSLIKPIGRISATLQMQGTYEDLKEFLKDLETNIRIFDVEGLNFSASGETEGIPVYGFGIQVVTYYQNP